MRKRVFSQISLLVIAFVLLFSSSLVSVFADGGSDTGVAAVGGSSGWRLQIDNSSNSSLVLSLDDLAAMPRTVVYAELFCYGNLVMSGEWGGVRLGFLLEKAGLDEQATGVDFYALDGYRVNLPMSSATSEDVIVAYEKDGLPLPETLRLVVPGANGDVWISMITRISMQNSVEPTSPNPYPASLILGQLPAVQPSPTPQPSSAPEPSNQSTSEPIVPAPTGQPVLQPESSNLSSQVEYGFLIVSAIIVITAVSAGYLFYKNRK